MMTTANLNAVLRMVRKLAEDPAVRDLGDAELLERFRDGPDESAFAVLVQRHGPMVLGVCRRLLGNSHDAEDAFQATFLVLARNAGSIRKGESLAAWLHGVARRVALKARARDQARRQHERQSVPVSASDPVSEAVRRELRALLDEEIGQLPEAYRPAVVLCCLEGKTQEQAAQDLGCPRTTLASRLDRGRDILRQRLARRGVALSAVGLAAVLASEATGSVPPVLLLATVRAALGLAGGAAVAGASATAAALAQGVAHGTAWGRWKVAALLTACLLLMGTLAGAAVLAFVYVRPGASLPHEWGGGAGVPAGPDVDDMLQEVLGGQLDRRLVCLEVSYGGKVPGEKGVARIFGNGVGAWGSDRGFEKPFTLTNERMTALLTQARDTGMGKMLPKVSGQVHPQIAINPVAVPYLQVTLYIQNVRKSVLCEVPQGQSIYQPPWGPEATRLVNLAVAVRKLAEPAAEKSAPVGGLEVGLRKIVGKELPPEQLYFSLHYTDYAPQNKGGKRGGEGPPNAETKIAAPVDGWSLSIMGPFAQATRRSVNDPPGRAPVAYVLGLSREELADLAKLFRDADLDGLLPADPDFFTGLPRNLAHRGRGEPPSSIHMQIDAAVVQPKVRRVMLGPQFKVAPAHQKAFDRMFNTLDQLNRRVLKQGQPLRNP